MNLVIIPFHDLHTSIKYGFRTRDAHLYKHFIENKNFQNIVLINRPISLIERFFINKKNKIHGDIFYKDKDVVVSRYKNAFVLDFYYKEFFSTLLLKHKWFLKKYDEGPLLEKINFILKKLNIKEFNLYISNPLGIKLGYKLNAKVKIFDAVDIFTKYKNYAYFKDELLEMYRLASKEFNQITCNTNATKEYFVKNFFRYNNICVIANGVDYEFFRKSNSKIPKDLQNIKRPIIGYAGKMQQMFDVELLRSLSLKFPDISFVLLGKYLDKSWMKPIEKLHNVFYLGDKHYDQLPDYLNNFDICFIPYNKINQHGGDPIKFYEYLAVNKPIISMNIGEIQKYSEYDNIKIVETRSEFIDGLAFLLKNSNKNILHDLPYIITWKYKADLFINMFNAND